MTSLLALLNVATLLFLVACLPRITERNARRALGVFASIILINLVGWIVL